MNGLNVQEVSWEDLKTLVSSKGLQLQYESTSLLYRVYAVEFGLYLYTTIWKSGATLPVGVDPATNTAARTDFENNYLASANAAILNKQILCDPESGSPLEIIEVGGKNYLGVSLKYDPTSSDVQEVRLRDGTTTRLAAVDSSGRLATTTNVIIPETAVSVNRLASSDLAGSDDDDYLIPNGKVLTIARFGAGAEANSGHVTQALLYHDPNGDGTGMTLLREIFLGPGDRNYQVDLDLEFTGDGTAQIKMRRNRLDGGSDLVTAYWDGFRDA